MLQLTVQMPVADLCMAPKSNNVIALTVFSEWFHTVLTYFILKKSYILTALLTTVF